MFFEQTGRQQPREQPQAERDDNGVIDQSEDRNEIWNQVDRGEGISGDGEADQPRRPGRARVSRREPNRMRLDTKAGDQRWRRAPLHDARFPLSVAKAVSEETKARAPKARAAP
jgi:hypothetical protein